MVEHMTGQPDQSTGGHTVLVEADGSAYQSLRQRPVTRAARYALGKSLRKQVPRRSLADWEPPSDRPDPIRQIIVSHQGRADNLIPIRVGRMIASPYGFLRGSAVVMAEDVAHLPATGTTPVVCGDSHLGNFGFSRLAGTGPGGSILNDFDRAPTPAGAGVGPPSAGRQHLGRRAPERGLRGAVRRVARSCVVSYREELTRVGRPTALLAFLPSDWTSTGWPRRRPVHCRKGLRARPGERVTALAIAHCPGSRARSTESRKSLEEPPLITRLEGCLRSEANAPCKS